MGLVLDASVLTELLVMSPLGARALTHVSPARGDLHVPHLADVECTSVFRGLVRGGILTSERAGQALVDLRDFPARRWPGGVLLERVWELRDNLTAYDATYVALAEALDADLITADAKLARGAAGATSATIIVVS
ncbi:twitching motility protein PilT [Microbacterium mangrovi]|uniref:Ribonuclease VapC n=1 Tax=Microbacterium mangrovi TaxID=1348253 RepID=A0A0B2A6K1_9MICO|nr:type II toxin-antitoxin system VapC family toxin [Microbacterium mangrovi]KHK97173.1 twitching motility protein PilT [Microbacterium mangrovi]